MPTPSVETALRWVLAHPDIAASLLALLTGGAGALRRYRRTGRFSYRALPWRAIRRLAYTARRLWFRYPKPDTTRTVAMSSETIAERLGRQSYELEWPLSLHYNGEDINARRYLYDPEREYPHRQLHVRAWDRGGMTELYAHEEPSAIHHPRVHLESTDMTDATDWVYERLHQPSGLDPRGFPGDN